MSISERSKGVRKFDKKIHNRTVKTIESDMISMHLGKSFEIDNEMVKIIKTFIRSIKIRFGGAKINKENNIKNKVIRKFLRLILFRITRK